jgi:hypothetical protein
MNTAPSRPGQNLKIDDVVIRYIRDGYQTISRSPSNAFLMRPKRFNRLALLWFFVGFVGLPIYWAWFLLFKRERSVIISADLDGYVTSIEKRSGALTRGSLIGGIALCLLVVSIFVAVGVTIKNSNDQMTGVHVCVDVEFSVATDLCMSDTHSMSASQVAGAHFVAGLPTGSSIGFMDSLTISITGTTSSGGGVTGSGNADFQGGGGAKHTYGDLSGIFADSHVDPRPGTYIITIFGTSGASQQPIGTYPLTIAN